MNYGTLVAVMKGRMMGSKNLITRRNFTVMMAVGVGSAMMPGRALAGQKKEFLSKRIPSTGEALPLIGLGSWITFNVGNDPQALASSAEVIRAFFDAGGRMIDSSPMYGSSQATIGHSLRTIGLPEGLFPTDKVWTNGVASGKSQIEESQQRWDIPGFALLQVHNLRDWKRHLPTLFEMKRAGRLKYVGITTSHGRRHREVEHILKHQPVDFLQLTYNITHRAAEARLLPLARERGIAVIINRPFDGGRLIRGVKKHPFPAWALKEGFLNWADFLLKFNVSHPAVTCAIPATSRVPHVRENMAACRGRLPEAALRKRMAAYIEAL